MLKTNTQYFQKYFLFRRQLISAYFQFTQEHFERSQDPVGSNEMEKDEKRDSGIYYGIDDIPPWYLCIPMAFQVNCEMYLRFSVRTF